MQVVLLRLQTKSLNVLINKSSPSCYIPITSLISCLLNTMPNSKIESKGQKAATANLAAAAAAAATTTTASSRTREVKNKGKGKVDGFDTSSLSDDVKGNKRTRSTSPEESKLVNNNINSNSIKSNKSSADTTVKSESGSGSTDSSKKKLKITHSVTPLSSPPSSFTTLPFATSSSSSSSSPAFDSDEVKFISGLNWVDLHISPLQLRPDVTLATGQCFNWKIIDKGSIAEGTRNIWIGVLDDIPLAICQTSESTLFALLSPSSQISDIKSVTAKLYDYFQVEHDLDRLYSLWSSQCPRMKEVAMLVAGLRVVRQNPWECLISFLCSSNNNIKRITQMLDNLRRTYGVYICTLTTSEDGISWKLTTNGAHSNSSNSSRDIHLYSFPTVEELSRTTEEELRAMGFGYRASFITKTIEEMLKKTPTPMQWLYNLRDHGKKNTHLSQAEVRNFVQGELLSFHGIGRKVADCIAVFSLDQDGVVPVDTHVWDICVRDYAPQLESSKSLTDRIYNEVGDIFRDRFVEKAGWAHSVLFAAELPEIKGLLSDKTQLEMKLFSESRKNKKIAIKNEKKIKEEGVAKVANVAKGGKK